MVANVETRKLEELMFDPLVAIRAAAEARAAVQSQTRSVDLGPTNDYSPPATPGDILQFLCQNCNEPVEESMWKEHHEFTCRNRIIFCPNKRLGCCAKVLLSKLFYHLDVHAVDKDRSAKGLPVITEPTEEMFAVQHEKLSITKQRPVPSTNSAIVLTGMDEYGCTVERKKEVLVAKSKKRREYVVCSGCGEQVTTLMPW
jgi:hypothetical protein